MLDSVDNKKVCVVCAYINPTSTRSQRNLDNTAKIETTAQIAMVNNIHLIVGGDFNQDYKHMRQRLNNYGYQISKVGPTRQNGRKEIDMIGSSDGQTTFSKTYEAS